MDDAGIAAGLAGLEQWMNHTHILAAGIKQRAAAARDRIDGHVAAAIHGLAQSHPRPCEPGTGQQGKFQVTHPNGPVFDRATPAHSLAAI
jgi:hypothetical protein